MKKYKDKYEFAEKLVNKLPWVKGANIKIEINKFTKTFMPRKGDTFSFGSSSINFTMLDYLKGLIDGAIYAYEELEKEK